MQKALQILLFCSMVISIQAAEDDLDAMVPSKGIVSPDWELFPQIECDQEEHSTLLSYPVAAPHQQLFTFEQQEHVATSCLASQPRKGCVVIDGVVYKLDVVLAPVKQSYEKPYACGACYRSFKTEDAYKSHAITHLPDRRFACWYEGCDKVFDKSAYLTNHLRVHTHERPYVCEVCSESFKQPHHLKEHAVKHTKEKVYACDYLRCCKSFARARYLKKHKETHDLQTIQKIRKNKTHDNAPRDYLCDYPECDRAFKQCSHLKEHLLRHNKERPYPCLHPGCGKSYICSRELEQHRLTRHPIT